MRYEHTQQSPLWLLVAIPLFVISSVVAAAAEGDTSAILIGVGGSLLVIAVVANFSRLRVVVSDDAVDAVFGLGWPSKRIPVADIAGVEPVRNRWFWGWGVRVVPGGWMWNVWGLDAVEVELRSGKSFRIGTDDQQGLYAALLSVARSV